VSYDSEVFSIPIRLATLNSPGEQDMVIYAITDTTDGSVGIANYPEFTVPDGCVWGDPATDSFAAVYDGLYTDAWSAVGDAAWTTEYSSVPGGANPAAGTLPTQEQLTSLGFPGSSSASVITRLHMRYTPEQADQDLTLYAQHMTRNDASAYADASPNNDCIEYNCDGTLNVDSGGTDTDLDSDEDTSSDSGGGTPGKSTGCGCAATPGRMAGPTGTGLLVGLGALLRRRRGAQKQ